MRIGSINALAFLCVVVAGCRDNPERSLSEPAADIKFSWSVHSRRVSDRYIVLLNDRVVNVADAARAVTEQHGGMLHRVFSYAGRGFSASLSPQAVEALRRNPMIKLIEPVREFENAVAGDTSQFNAPWALDRIDQVSGPLNGTFTYSHNGTGVKIYVLDTVARTDHIEFSTQRAIVGQSFVGVNVCHGHGTGVASLAAGRTYGTAKGAEIVSVGVLDCLAFGTTETVLAGVDYVTAQKAANPQQPMVANLSLVLPKDSALSVTAAVNDLLAEGVTVVAAAGGTKGYGGMNACDLTPAHIGGVITVAASNSSDQPWVDSNNGSCIDLYAPGEGVTAATHISTTAAVSWTGTSQAAPQAAGVAATYLQRNPTAMPATVASAVVKSANSAVAAPTGTSNKLLYNYFFDVQITGPSIIPTQGATHTWTASMFEGAPPFQYQWWRTGANGTTLVSTSLSYTEVVNDCLLVELQLIVTDANGRIDGVYKGIIVKDTKCGPLRPGE